MSKHTRSSYSDETKAAVMAALLAGQSVSSIAAGVGPTCAGRAAGGGKRGRGRGQKRRIPAGNLAPLPVGEGGVLA